MLTKFLVKHKDALFQSKFILKVLLFGHNPVQAALTSLVVSVQITNEQNQLQVLMCAALKRVFASCLLKAPGVRN